MGTGLLLSSRLQTLFRITNIHPTSLFRCINLCILPILCLLPTLSIKHEVHCTFRNTRSRFGVRSGTTSRHLVDSNVRDESRPRRYCREAEPHRQILRSDGSLRGRFLQYGRGGHRRLLAPFRDQARTRCHGGVRGLLRPEQFHLPLAAALGWDHRTVLRSISRAAVGRHSGGGQVADLHSHRIPGNMGRNVQPSGNPALHEGTDAGEVSQPEALPRQCPLRP